MATLVQASSLRPRVDVASRTDAGRDPDKQVNEDAFAYRPTPFGHLLVVCDGMGGHNSGEEASNLALRTVVETLEGMALDAPVRAALDQAVRTANDRVYGLAPPDATGRPGSTIVAALLQSSGIVVAHVGDSRAYLLRQGHALALTRDHSVVQQMVDAGMLTPEQAVGHPDANRILRALGVAAAVDVEVRIDAVPFAQGDTIVLCTDGLTDLVTGPEIARAVLEAGSPAAGASRLVDMANERGGHDNITVLAARFLDDVTSQPQPTVVATAPHAQPAGPPPYAYAPAPYQAPPGYAAPAPPMMAPPMGQVPPPPQSGGTLPPLPPPFPGHGAPAAPGPRTLDGSSSRSGGERVILIVGLVLAFLLLAVLAAFIGILTAKSRGQTPAFAIDAGAAPASSSP